ncbi:MAG: 3-dehydroquinate synthase [Nevskiaceae bacterium]|nr:MAG: 3-dehydroquinate synthase [Nevskiaceae bacterium]TBR72638.1 MAG: 3-dehydroquinate synthase [Nevskiaceae bacterium]
MTETMDVALGARSYSIHIGAGLLDVAASYRAIGARPRFIVSDSNVAPLYLQRVAAALGVPAVATLVVPAGEETKRLATVERVLDKLMEARFPRDGVLVALGGGVVGDLTGFVAAIYQRGAAFVQVPTTLLAQVDSSVGGKTGVNHPLGKNMIGAFHQPLAVVADTDTLATLPPRELSAGLAEVIKYGLLGDAAFFAELESNVGALRALDHATLVAAIHHCCHMKADIVARDEREAGPRALLNLGHTFGHAIETFTGYGTWLHGEAVAVGLCMAADMSARMGWASLDVVARTRKLVERAGLPVLPPPGMTPGDFRTLMMHDKKVAAGHLRLVLLRSLGQAVVTADFDAQALDATLADTCKAAQATT